MMQQNRKNDMVFAGVVLLAHAVYFILALHYKRIYMGDSFEYVYEALNIKDRFFFYSGNAALPIEPEYMTQRQPVYPLLLAGVYTIVKSNWAVVVLQNLLSAGNILYCRQLFRQYASRQVSDAWLMALVLLYPSQFINANTIAPDILLQTFTLLYFGSFLRLIRERSIKSVALMSMWLIAGMLVKPVLYPFAYLHLVVVSAMFIRWKIAPQRAMLAAVLPLTAVLLYNYSNLKRTGKFHFSSNQAFNAVYYYNPYYTHKYGADSAARFLTNERQKLAAIPDYSERYDAANAQGMTLLKENGLPYLIYHATCAGKAFIDPGKAEMDLFTGKLTYGKLYNSPNGGFMNTVQRDGMSGVKRYLADNPSMPLALLILLANIVRMAGILLFVIRERNKYLKWGAVVLMLYFTMAAGPIANTRYFLPVALIAMGCAAAGFSKHAKYESLYR